VVPPSEGPRPRAKNGHIQEFGLHVHKNVDNVEYWYRDR
jgi:hypothetical protein